MKSRVLISVVLLAVTTAYSADDAADEPAVTMELDHFSLPQAIEALANASNVIFIVDPRVVDLAGPKIRFESLPLSRAIQVVAAGYGVCAEKSDRIVRIRPCEIAEDDGKLDGGSPNKPLQPIAREDARSG